MDQDEFWTLIDQARQAGPTRREREEFLQRRLRPTLRADLLDFVQFLSGTREPANTYRLWRAADIMLDGASTDSFHYVQMWPVGLGRDAYEAAIADPDSLADVPEVRRLARLPRPWADEDSPEWESLEYVAVDVGDQRDDIDGDIRDVVSTERGVQLRMDPDPADLEWRIDNAELRRRYPRLWVLFGEHFTLG